MRSISGTESTGLCPIGYVERGKKTKEQSVGFRQGRRAVRQGGMVKVQCSPPPPPAPSYRCDLVPPWDKVN